ncbi:response regulator [Nodosilinea sp. E11]|uniref:response regulator n=1 Tax=Nodosilinea sp. E11 TaxID=3037479 RepID=UPI0029350EC6|nr:response regulator [Nodosilinea sp. E11]WOD40317.1 response regulator [Nodosilinea sp. E11]
MPLVMFRPAPASVMGHYAPAPADVTILVVDDSLENLKLLSRVLQQQGYGVRCVRSGEMALTGVRAMQPDLILLDIRMPGMDGYALCQCLKADAATQSIPVIFLSALGDVADKVKAFDAGAADYLARPFQVEELVVRVANQLTIHALQRQTVAQNQQLQQEIRDRTLAEANLQQVTARLIDNSESLGYFSRSLKELHRLSLTRFASFDELLSDYLRTGCRMLGFSGGIVGRIDGPDYVAKAMVANLPGLEPDLRCSLDDTFCGMAIRHQITVSFDHVGAIPELRTHPIYQQLKLEAYLGTPIVVEGDVYGSLCFFDTAPRPQGFKQHETEIIELMAQSISKVISTHRLEQQQQQAKAELLASEQKFRQLAEYIDSVFWIYEPQKRQFCYVSPAYESIWGRSCSELYENPAAWIEAVHPSDRRRICSRLPDRSDAAALANFSYDEEFRIVQPQGQQAWVRVRAFPIRDAEGEVYRLVGVVEDLSQTKRQEESLRLMVEGTAAKTGHDFFESLVRYLADILQVRCALVAQRLPTDDRQVSALAFWQNGVLAECYQYDLIDTPCERVLAGEVVYVPCQVQALYPTNTHLQELAAESFLGIPLVNRAGGVIGHLAVIDDRPMVDDQTRELILRIFAARAAAELERQQAEDALRQAREAADRANRAKSMFLANMSHELRTPLNTIIGFSQLITRDCHLDSETRNYLEIVSHSGEHLLALINDVLELSKIEAGRASLNISAFNLSDLLISLEAMLILQAEAKGLHLTFDCDPALPTYIATDEGKLRQTLINLLNNAIKFTPSGWVILRVSPALPLPPTIAHPQANAALEFTVIDTGPGIVQADLDKLFEPFTQTDAGLQWSKTGLGAAYQGSGLGLPLSQQLVRLMGGDLTVETQIDCGSAFAFTLPVQVIEELDQTPASTPAPILKLAPGQPPYRILVVEDHSANRYLLVRLLQSVGFDVQAAQDGREAVEKAQLWQPHLIWMDIRMPYLDGYTATRQIKALSLTPRPVIVALTASPFEEERAKILAAGCDDFVRKPFQIQAILEKIADYLPVRYLYGIVDPNATETPPPQRLDPAEMAQWLQTMPVDWQQALTHAAMSGSDRRLVQLLDQMDEAPQAVVQTLSAWAQSFQFDSILACLSSSPP